MQKNIRVKSIDYSNKLTELDELNSSIAEKSNFIFQNIMERNSEITQLYESLDEVSKTFHEISGKSEELTATGVFLKKLASILSSLVGKFKVQNKKPILLTGA